MKRVKAVSGFWMGALVLTLSACAGAGPEETGAALPSSTSGWTRTPDIRSVAASPGALTFAGAAQPGARVVLRSPTGVAYAAAADAEGRFEIRIAAPRDFILLQPETQVGQESARSPDLLIVLDGGRGPVALLRAGGAARRLDDAPPLGAVDSDGRSVVASGRSAAPEISISPGGGAPGRIRPESDGTWAILMSATPGDTVRIEEQSFRWPGPGQPSPDLVVERAGDGWRIGWSATPGARQWTWLPTLPAA